MQEKLIEILSRATAWMTAPQIADAGGWRSELFALVPVGVATRKKMSVIVFQELAA